jgi:hypothetical protein
MTGTEPGGGPSGIGAEEVVVSSGDAAGPRLVTVAGGGAAVVRTVVGATVTVVVVSAGVVVVVGISTALVGEPEPAAIRRASVEGDLTASARPDDPSIATIRTPNPTRTRDATLFPAISRQSTAKASI